MYSIIITTCSNEEDALKIIEALLAGKLAACIQCVPIKSFYTWKEKTAIESEIQLLIKAKAALYNDIEATIREHHKYEVPEIIQVAISAGTKSYFKWIDEVSR